MRLFVQEQQRCLHTKRFRLCHSRIEFKAAYIPQCISALWSVFRRKRTMTTTRQKEEESVIQEDEEKATKVPEEERTLDTVVQVVVEEEEFHLSVSGSEVRGYKQWHSAH